MNKLLVAIFCLVSNLAISQSININCGISTLRYESSTDNVGVTYGMSFGYIGDNARVDFGIGRFHSSNDAYSTNATSFTFDLGHLIKIGDFDIAPGVFIHGFIDHKFNSDDIEEGIIKELIQLNKISIGPSIHLIMPKKGRVTPKAYGRYGISNINAKQGKVKTMDFGLALCYDL